jgi:hypothetical protein
MWPHRLHILAPLTAKTGALQKGEKHPPFQWTPEMQKEFDQMKALMAAGVICAYPDHNKPFLIFTDASDYQLVHASCKKTSQLHILARNLTVHR